MREESTKHNTGPGDLTNPDSEEEHLLILHNDDVNTFEFVIDSLVEVCGHDPLQAEQCAFITHHLGKCDIKKGQVKLLVPMHKALAGKGLVVTID